MTGWILIIIAASAILVYGIYSVCNTVDAVSFEDSFNKVGLPVIQFFNDNYPLNFLVDTGSDNNFIDENIMEYLHYTETDEKRGVLCASGETSSRAVFLTINDTEDCITEKFYTLDMKSMNEEHSMNINGILGSKFCSDAGLVLDFSNKVIYAK